MPKEYSYLIFLKMSFFLRKTLPSVVNIDQYILARDSARASALRPKTAFRCVFFFRFRLPLPTENVAKQQCAYNITPSKFIAIKISNTISLIEHNLCTEYEQCLHSGELYASMLPHLSGTPPPLSVR